MTGLAKADTERMQIYCVSVTLPVSVRPAPPHTLFPRRRPRVSRVSRVLGLEGVEGRGTDGCSLEDAELAGGGGGAFVRLRTSHPPPPGVPR